MSRRRRSDPTPAQIWGVVRALAHEVRAGHRRALAREAAYRRADEERRKTEQAARDQERAARDQERAAREQERARRDQEWARRDQERARRDQERAEFDRQWQARLNKIAGDGDNRFGELMEALVEGRVVPLFREVGLDVERAYRRVKSIALDEWREYDVVAVGPEDAVVVEVKTTLRPRDVARLTDRIRDFREWRPDLARPRVWGALGYLSANPEAVRAAEAAGFYVIRVVSTTAAIVNSEGFEPRVF